MKTVMIPLSDLRRPERNVRMHTDKQIKEFRRSIEMFGQIRPIVVDENNTMLAGNGLYETLLSMGRTEAACYVVTGLSEKEKKKLMLADNRIFDLGVDDMNAFDSFIAELGDDLDVPGFDDDLLRSIVADCEEVDDMMSSYGVIDEERKEQIREARTEYEHQEAQRTEPAPVTPRPEPPADQPEAAGRFVVCPKCGEKIWL